MDFREAIMALKQGEQIRRVNWQVSYYLVLVRLSENGPITKLDDYVESTLGVIQQTLTTRIDWYDGNQLLQQSWMATPEDIGGEWQLLPQIH